MSWTSAVRPCSAAVPALLLAGCATMDSMMGWFTGDVLVPDEPGLYALQPASGDSDDLIRLDGNREWEKETWPRRSSLPKDTVFLVRHGSLQRTAGHLAEAIVLERVAWVRSAITEEGKIMPVQGNDQWAGTGLEYLHVPLQIARVPGHPDMVRAVPGKPLNPGLYSLSLASAESRLQARFGVQWQTLDKTAYSASVCVDRYLTNGSTAHYRRCSEQQQAYTAKWLKIYLVKPDLEAAGIGGQALNIQGVIVNTSDRRRAVPLCEVQLRSASGTVLKEWRFDPGIPALAAGESSSFRTRADNPPPDAYSVHVRFGTAGSEFVQRNSSY